MGSEELKQQGGSREERLVRVVQRLEAKVKTLWDEKNALVEQLELASLDKELAEERYYAMETALRNTSDEKIALEARITELEELRKLNVELEDSYVTQKQELSLAIDQLQKELEAADQRNRSDAAAAQSRIDALLASQTSEQSVETLRQELQFTKLQLSACKLDLDVERHGMVKALRPIFSEHLPDRIQLLPFIDYYKLQERLRDPFDSFRSGESSIRVFAQAIENEITLADETPTDNKPDWMAVINLLRVVEHPTENQHLRTVLLRLLDAQLTGEVHRIIQELAENVSASSIDALYHEVQKGHAQTPVDMEHQADYASPRSESDAATASQEVETLNLRVRILESKLQQAQNLAAEIDALKVEHTQARGREAHLERLLAEAADLRKSKDYEIAKLRRAELPTTIDAALVQQKLESMASALKWFSRSHYRRLTLDPLPLRQPRRISVLTGNTHVSAMRKTVLDFDLVAATADGKWRPHARQPAMVALDQFEKLLSLGCEI